MVRERYLQSQQASLALAAAAAGDAPRARPGRYTYELPGAQARPAPGAVVAWTQHPYAAPRAPGSASPGPAAATAMPGGWLPEAPYRAHLTRLRQERFPWIRAADEFGIPV